MLTRQIALFLGLFGAFVSSMTPALALPVFAHRYGFSCQACHTTVPQLNEFGERFRANGFRLPQSHGAFPVAVKVNLQYSSNADGTGLPKAIVDEIELLSGGSIGKAFSYFLEQYAVDGGTPGKTRDAWVQYNGSSGLGVRAGQFTLALPVDVESERPTLAHYALLEPLFDARDGVDLNYGSDRGLEMHAAVLDDGGAATHLYASQSFASGTTVFAYAFNSPFVHAGGFAASQRIGKASVLALAQNGGSFVEGQYAFSSALALTARKEQGFTIVSFAARPRRNMRLTVEDDISSRHALGVGWLFAY